MTMTAYFEQHYCLECACVHWMQVTQTTLQCLGEAYYPKAGPDQHTRRSGRGIELVYTSRSPAIFEMQELEINGR